MPRMMKFTHCIICQKPLPPRRWWHRILEPPPFCQDVEACIVRMKNNMGIDDDNRS